MLPPPIKIDLRDRVQTLWSERVIQHLLDSYAGLPLLKFPEDLRVYEHLLWETRSNVVESSRQPFGRKRPLVSRPAPHAGELRAHP